MDVESVRAKRAQAESSVVCAQIALSLAIKRTPVGGRRAVKARRSGRGGDRNASCDSGRGMAHLIKSLTMPFSLPRALTRRVSSSAVGRRVSCCISCRKEEQGRHEM